MSKLQGKITLVTGGNSGIGLATAKHFVAEGAEHVYITGRRQAELDVAAKEIYKNVTAVQGDVSKLADLDKLYATIKQKHGRLDVIFANAGGGDLINGIERNPGFFSAEGARLLYPQFTSVLEMASWATSNY